mgnify:CR=1 FL=1
MAEPARLQVELTGRRALVTGATQGIGLAIATALADSGATVCLNGPAAGEELDAACLAAAATLGVAADLTQAADIERLITAANDRLGGIDILVLNAALQERAPWHGFERAALDRQWELNLAANYRLMQAFVPAMLKTADEAGIPNFHIFGEVYRDTPDNGYIAQYTRRDGFPAVLDFAFAQALRETVGQGKGTHVLTEMFDGDVLYEGGEEAALALPTFLGNHDMGRFSTLVKADRPEIGQEELLARVKLAHAMLLTLRGSPVIYYGDEQGFVGDGNDQAAREDMFPSRTASYNDNDLIGTDATTAQGNFDESHPLFELIAEFSAIRRANPALSRGRQVVRHYDQEPGIFAVSRFDPDTGEEYLAAFNTADAERSANIVVGYDARSFDELAGTCPAKVSAPGSAALTLPAFGWAVCRVSEVAE